MIENHSLNANIMGSERIINAELAVAEAVNNINFNDIESMKNGCNGAVVIMGINRFSHKLSKMVFAYNTEDTCFEDVVANANKLVKCSNFAVSRAFIYSIDNSKKVKHLHHIIYKTNILHELSEIHIQGNKTYKYNAV